MKHVNSTAVRVCLRTVPARFTVLNHDAENSRTRLPAPLIGREGWSEALRKRAGEHRSSRHANSRQTILVIKGRLDDKSI